MKQARIRSAKILDRIIKEIAHEQGISEKKVNIFLQSVFGGIANDMREGKFKSTRILNFGKFLVKPYRLQKYLEKQNGNNIKN